MMTIGPVSVVVACYNHREFIGECIRSVAAQERGRLELIVIDDASNDDSYAAAMQVLNEDVIRGRFERVVIERNSVNLGASATWNKAVARARGGLIFLLNSDDCFSRNRVSRFLDQAGTSGLYFGMSYTKPVDRYGRAADNATAAEIKYKSRCLTQSLPAVSWACLEYNISISTGNFVFTRQLWDAIGGLSNLRYCHDWEFMLRASTIVEPSVVSEELYRYRLHDDNSFRTLSNIAREEAFRCFRSYAEMALMRKPTNGECLSPHNQGAAFYDLARLVPNFQLWLTQFYEPYRSVHRTVSENPYTMGTYGT